MLKTHTVKARTAYAAHWATRMRAHGFEGLLEGTEFIYMAVRGTTPAESADNANAAFVTHFGAQSGVRFEVA
jgi:hypothetical protein